MMPSGDARRRRHLLGDGQGGVVAIHQGDTYSSATSISFADERLAVYDINHNRSNIRDSDTKRSTDDNGQGDNGNNNVNFPLILGIGIGIAGVAVVIILLCIFFNKKRTQRFSKDAV
jgi:hypothetical protein